MKIAFLYRQYNSAATINDHINAFSLYSQNKITYFNIASDHLSYLTLCKFDALIIHYTISIFDNANLPASLKELIRLFPRKKIIFIQDEYRFVNTVIELLNYLKIDVLFTCIPTQEIEKVYPKEKCPNLIKINTLTGYVPNELLQIPRPPYEERQLDVIYRARKISARYGRLALEKWQIADKFANDAAAYKLNCDLSYEESARIYGQAWNEFIAKSKAALGVESGASVFDFTGEITQLVKEYETQHPDASFEEIEAKCFPGLDGLIYVNQISPRCFEYAALGTLMILYEGDYSGILIPYRHYIPLKKDHSNMAEVVKAIRDPELWQTITNTAYIEIACNDQYSYKGFIAQFDQVMQQYQTKYYSKFHLLLDRLKAWYTQISLTIQSLPERAINNKLMLKLRYRFKHRMFPFSLKNRSQIIQE